MRDAPVREKRIPSAYTNTSSEIVRFDSVGASQMPDRKLKGYACAHVLPRYPSGWYPVNAAV